MGVLYMDMKLILYSILLVTDPMSVKKAKLSQLCKSETREMVLLCV